MIKQILHASLRTFGLEVMATRNIEAHFMKLEKERRARSLTWLCDLGIKEVLDIGANTGQFAQEIHELLPLAVIHSFEPVPHVFEELKKNLGVIPGAKAYNTGIGAENGQMTIHVNEFSPTSSLLSMTHQQRHEFAQRFPEIAKDQKEAVVTVRRLDDIALEMGFSRPCLVKIDTEGYEINVIKGGRNTLKNSDIVVIETSFYELYKGQALFGEVDETMRSLGFYYAGAFGVNLSPRDGLILQQDSIFLPECYAVERKEFPGEGNLRVRLGGPRQ